MLVLDGKMVLVLENKALDRVWEKENIRRCTLLLRAARVRARENSRKIKATTKSRCGTRTNLEIKAEDIHEIGL